MSSTSRANGATSAKAASNKWQFVNVNEPKKNQDKDIISVVRAHAMRNVRRKQRMELTAQHQNKLKAQAPESDRADSNATAEPSVQISLDDRPIGDKADLDWSISLREMLSKLEFTNLGHLASSKEAELAAEYDQDAQRPDYWQSYGEDETRASKQFMLGIHRPESPKSLIGDGVFDPFDVMPISGCANYNSHALNHCRCFILSTFLFGHSRYEPKVLHLIILLIHSRFDHWSQLCTSRPGYGSEHSLEEMAAPCFARLDPFSRHPDFRGGTSGDPVWKSQKPKSSPPQRQLNQGCECEIGRSQACAV